MGGQKIKYMMKSHFSLFFQIQQLTAYRHKKYEKDKKNVIRLVRGFFQLGFIDLQHHMEFTENWENIY